MQTQPTDSLRSKQPLVSFIIPVYNVPVDMVHECIASITALSLRPFEREIIVVDDGSDACQLNDITDYTDNLIYIRQKNKGVSTARNQGLRMAHGSFIQFIDGDDKLLQAPYEHVLDIVRYQKADMVTFDFTKNDTVDNKYEDGQPTTGTQFMRNNNIHGSVCGYIFKRNILGELQFTPGMAYGEDEEFTAQLLLRAENVVCTSAKAYYYRMRQASAINAQDMESRLKRLNDNKEVLYSLHNKADTMPTDERMALQRRVAQLTMDYIYNIIILTQDHKYLTQQLEELRTKGLFPLPDRNYTKKYNWFRRMTNSDFGLTILMRTLPLINKER